MPTKTDIRQSLNPPPPGQFITTPGNIQPAPGAPRDFRLVRHRTMDFDLWGVVQDWPVSTPFFSPRPTETTPSGPAQEMERPATDPLPYQFPILGPTRQQTELYLKKKRSKRKTKQSVVPVGAPENLGIGTGRSLSHAEFAVFDDKAANAVLMDAEANIRSGYPTIATSTMVTRRNINSSSEDFEIFKPDIRFFSELVKPIQYRWRLRNSNGRVVVPSKRGYHPRSKSPTFQRLVEATERLQIISEHDSGMGSIDKSEEELETRSNPGVVDKTSAPLVSIRQIRSEPASLRTESTATNSTAMEEQTPPTYLVKPSPRPQSLSERPTERNNSAAEESEEENIVIPPRKTKKKHGFKVDFKRHDSRSELHLFLPQIHEGHYRGDTPDSPNCHATKKFAFPMISELTESRDEDKSAVKPRKERPGKNFPENKKKRKKQVPRVKSGSSEKHIPDVLNDIPTLISLENEKDHNHTDSDCAFDKCVYHSKSTKLRQP